MEVRGNEDLGAVGASVEKVSQDAAEEPGAVCLEWCQYVGRYQSAALQFQRVVQIQQMIRNSPFEECQ